MAGGTHEGSASALTMSLDGVRELQREAAYWQTLSSGLKHALYRCFEFDLVTEEQICSLPRLSASDIRKIAIDLEKMETISSLFSSGPGHTFFSSAMHTLQGYFGDEEESERLLADALGVMVFFTDYLFPSKLESCRIQ